MLTVWWSYRLKEIVVNVHIKFVFHKSRMSSWSVCLVTRCIDLSKHCKCILTKVLGRGRKPLLYVSEFSQIKLNLPMAIHILGVVMWPDTARPTVRCLRIEERGQTAAAAAAGSFLHRLLMHFYGGRPPICRFRSIKPAPYTVIPSHSWQVVIYEIIKHHTKCTIF